MIQLHPIRPGRDIPGNRAPRLQRTLLAASVAVLLSLCLSFADSAAGAVAASRDYARPDVREIRSETVSILQDARYAPRKSLRQWLLEKLAQRRWASSDSLTGWAVLIFSLLTFLLILALSIWHLVMFFRGLAPGLRVSGFSARASPGIANLTYDELLEKVAEFARLGKFRKAVGFMMVALLRWLDKRRLLVFHESKTNGDYLRELTSTETACHEFKDFVRSFDGGGERRQLEAAGRSYSAFASSFSNRSAT